MIIENILYDQYKEIFDNKDKYIVNGINTDILGKNLYKYIDERKNVLEQYTDKLIDNPNGRIEFEKVIFSSIDKSYIINLCLVTFLRIYSHQNTENTKKNRTCQFSC